MGTISEKLSYLEETKELIKQAIVDKGVEVNDTDTFRSYADKISEIEGGGGAIVLPSSIRFQDAKDTDLSTFINANTNTSNLTTMQYMFYGCQNITSLDVSNFDTSKVTSLYNCFRNCTKLMNLDVSRWDTSNVTNFQDLFYSSGIRYLNVSNWDLSKSSETTYSAGCAQIFRDMGSLQTIDCQNTKVPEKVYYLGYMFNECASLNTFDYFDKFNPAYVRDINNAFTRCINLKSIDWSEKVFDTSQSYINCCNTFKNCYALKSVKLNTTNNLRCEGMFRSCKALTDVDFDGVKFYDGYGTTYGGLFQDCSNLVTVKNINFVNRTNGYNFFSYCDNLQKLEMDFNNMNYSSNFLNYFYTTSHGNNVGNALRYIHLPNIGSYSSLTSLVFNSTSKCNFYSWGDESDTTNYPHSVGARQSLVDTIVNDSFDRVAAGYPTCVINLYNVVLERLTEDEIAQATSKGYTLVV